MPQFRLHYTLAFTPQGGQGSSVNPHILWDVRYGPQFACLSADRRHRLPSSITTQPATYPPSPYVRITCGLFLSRSWTVDIHGKDGLPVTVGDVLSELYFSLRHRIKSDEWARASRADQTRIAEAFYARVRASANPQHEQRSGVRRVDWFLANTGFVGLAPYPERPYTWVLTLKRADR